MTGKKKEERNMANEVKIPHFTISGTITVDNTYEKFVEFHQKALNDKATSAIVYINSGGGVTAAAIGMSQIMVNSKIKFYTCGTGWCCSAALHTLAHGDVRCVTSQCSLMYHKLFSFAWGNPDEVMATGNRMKRQQKMLEREFAKRTKKDTKWWNAQAKKDANKMFWFYGKEAKKYGVVDHIGLPEISIERKAETHVVEIRKEG